MACKIEVLEWADKPNKFIVVEVCGNILKPLSGIAGQTKRQATIIANRIRKQRAKLGE